MGNKKPQPIDTTWGEKMPDHRIKIYVLPDGFVRSALESKEGGPTPVAGLALYSKLEPLILKFKRDVKKTVQGEKQKERRAL